MAWRPRNSWTSIIPTMRERYLRLTRENFRENGLSSGISPGISFQVAEHRFSGMGKTERGIYKAGNQPRPFDETLSPPPSTSSFPSPPQPHFSATFLPSSIPLASPSHGSSLATLWFSRVLLILPTLNAVFYYSDSSNPLCIPYLRICADCCSVSPFFFFIRAYVRGFYYRSSEEKYCGHGMRWETIGMRILMVIPISRNIYLISIRIL